jgi:hypothetical protein
MDIKYEIYIIFFHESINLMYRGKGLHIVKPIRILDPLEPLGIFEPLGPGGISNAEGSIWRPKTSVKYNYILFFFKSCLLLSTIMTLPLS